jgi:hypothetical protein
MIDTEEHRNEGKVESQAVRESELQSRALFESVSAQNGQRIFLLR